VFKVRAVGPFHVPCALVTNICPQLAESSAEKRQMIYDTFAALRDALIHAHPERRSFRTSQELNDCVDRLYQSVVDCIQDLAVWLTSEERSTCRRTTRPILQEDRSVRRSFTTSQGTK
jgi:hypothetical protein